MGKLRNTENFINPVMQKKIKDNMMWQINKAKQDELNKCQVVSVVI